MNNNIKVGPAEDESEEESQHHGAKAEVDTTSLTDAIMSDDIRAPAFPPSNRGHGVDVVQDGGVTFPQGSSSAELTVNENSSISSPLQEMQTDRASVPIPTFSTAPIYLFDGDSPAVRSTVFYITACTKSAQVQQTIFADDHPES